MTHVCYVHVFEHYDHVRSVNKRMAMQRLFVQCMPAETLGMNVHMMHHMQDTRTFYWDVHVMMLPISLAYVAYEDNPPPHQLPLMYHMERSKPHTLDRHSA